jgi:hypothetical protein
LIHLMTFTLTVCKRRFTFVSLWGLFHRGWSGRGVKLTTHVHLVPSLKMHGAVSLLSHAFAWRGTWLNVGDFFMALYFLKHRDNVLYICIYLRPADGICMSDLHDLPVSWNPFPLYRPVRFSVLYVCLLRILWLVNFNDRDY